MKILLAIVVLAASPAAAEVRLIFPHIGRLLDAEDHPVSGQVEITFAIYSVASDPNPSEPVAPRWKQKYTVTAVNGHYTVLLGAPELGQPISWDLFIEPDRWLGVAVGPGADPVELQPRMRFGAVPYAVYSNSAVVAATAASADSADEATHAQTADALACADCPTGTTLTAAKTPAPGVLLALDANGRVPAAALPPPPDLTGIDAELLDGRDTTATASPGAIPVLDGNGRLPAAMLPAAIDAATVAGKVPGTSAGNLVVLGNDARVASSLLPPAGDAPSLNGHTASDAASGDMRLAVLGTDFKIPSGMLNGELMNYSLFDGVLRRCPNGTFQTFVASTKSWSPAVCPTTWNCADSPTHAGCASSSQYSSCRAILADPQFGGGTGTYYIDPDGAGLTYTPFQVHCNMTEYGGGWTLVMVSANGGGTCRSTVIASAATTAPLDPAASPSNTAYMFATTFWNAIKDAGATRPGIWMWRRNQGSKWSPAACVINTNLPAQTSGECLKYISAYSDTPSWSTGDQPASTNSNCIGHGTANTVVAGCFYDSVNCNDAWGWGNTDVTNYYVR